MKITLDTTEQVTQQSNIDRFKSRVLESEVMSKQNDEWQMQFEKMKNSMLRNERNNGQSDVYEAMRELICEGKMYWDGIEDLIQTIKVKLANKVNN